jgi:hypothetical protein
MARIGTLHLKVDADTTRAVELAPRVKAAVHDGLTTARHADHLVFDEDTVATVIASAVMAEILRVRPATPAEAALARVRALHRNEYESCAECTHESSVTYPCQTIRALDGEEAPGV